MRDGFTRAPTGGFGRIGVALCPSATASKALARATWAAGSACERLMRTSQTRSWSVSFRRGSFWRRLIGKPPGEVEELAAYSTFARIATSMSSDPLVGYQHFTPVPRFAPECETVCLREPIEMAGVNAGFVGAPQRPSSGVVKDRLPFRYLAPSDAETHSPHGPPPFSHSQLVVLTLPARTCTLHSTSSRERRLRPSGPCSGRPKRWPEWGHRDQECWGSGLRAGRGGPPARPRRRVKRLPSCPGRSPRGGVRCAR